jgi:adenylate kinase
MLNIVLFGPPGAGKGTQSKKIEEKYHLLHISTGDLLFREVSAGTLLGQQAKQCMLAGKLVPDETVVSMIENKIKSNLKAAGFVFDGFPRNQKQAVTLDQLLESYQISISAVISLEVEEDELIKRMLQRGAEKGRFDDQNESIVKSRLVTYKQETLPLADYYQKQGKFAAISGIGSVDDIFEQICKKVSNLK